MEELKRDIEKILFYEKEKNEICKKIEEIEEKIKKLLFEKMPFLKANIYFSFSYNEIYFIFYYEGEENIADFAINFDENKEIKRIYIYNSDCRDVQDLTQFQKIVDPEKEAITFLQKIQENKTKLKTLCEEMRKLYGQNNNLVYNLKLKDQKNFLFDLKYYIFKRGANKMKDFKELVKKFLYAICKKEYIILKKLYK